MHSLQYRTKWKKENPIIKKGDLVVLIEDNAAPAHWALGRIEELHVGKDNRVRVVTVRSISELLKRVINRVCSLPLESIV